MKVDVSAFGEIDGATVYQYVLNNNNGMKVALLNYGGIIKEIVLLDKHGNQKHCVQTFNTLQEYINDESYRGAIVGRYANRIGHGKFSLDGQLYQLDKNGGEHNLHGGLAGFHKKVWHGQYSESEDSVSVTFTLNSPDGEGGFPGNVSVAAHYTLNNDNELSLHITANTDKATPMSFTQHAYFTLGNEKTIGNTLLYIDADQVTDADETLLPTGELVSVEGTEFDFRELSVIKEKAASSPASALYKMVGGYDHNYVLNTSAENAMQALVKAEDTGISMVLSTNLPGLQFYTGSLSSPEQLGALCLEPQQFPDAPNKAQFPNCIVQPGETLHANFRYQFSVQ